MDISFFPTLMITKMAKIANLSMSTCIVQLHIELIDTFISLLGKRLKMRSNRYYYIPVHRNTALLSSHRG